jgi:hypothetical protein
VLQTFVRRVTTESFTVKGLKEIWLQYQKTRADFRKKVLGLEGTWVEGGIKSDVTAGLE